MTERLAVVFGGTGFLGHAVVHALCGAGYRVRVASRRPDRAADIRLLGAPGSIDVVAANISQVPSVQAACDGAEIVINLVGLLYEKGRQSFNAVQTEGARNIANAAKSCGAKRSILVSAIGADSESRSDYARAKAAAEAAFLSAAPGPTVLRPSIIFGPQDSFFNRFADMAAMAPALPSIGGGRTRFQPIFVGDVADAIVSALGRPESVGRIYELGGPSVYTFQELLTLTMKWSGRQRFLANIPFDLIQPAAHVVDFLFRFSPFAPPITGDQIEMLRRDNVVRRDPKQGVYAAADLGMTRLHAVESVVPGYLGKLNRHKPS